MAEDPKATAQKIVGLAKGPVVRFVKKYQPAEAAAAVEAVAKHSATIVEISEALHGYAAMIHLSVTYLAEGPEPPEPFQKASVAFVLSLFMAGYNAGVADTQKEEHDAQVP